MLNVVTLNVVLLRVVTLNAVMLSVVAHLDMEDELNLLQAYYYKNVFIKIYCCFTKICDFLSAVASGGIKTLYLKIVHGQAIADRTNPGPSFQL